MRSMLQRVAAGGRPERASSWTIFCDLQTCISEPLRVTHYALDAVRRLFCNRGMGRGRECAMGMERETVNTAEERTGQKQSADADYYDYYINLQAEYYLQVTDDNDRRNFEDSDHEEVDPDWPPPSLAIYYGGDSPNVDAAYCFSRDLVELLSVRPRFPFAGTFAAFNDRSAYYFSSPKGQQQRNVDSQGNLLLRAQGKAIEDAFQIKIEIPDGDNGIDYGYLVFRVNPYACNEVITRTILTACGRKIDVAFVPLYCAIQARVFVTLDLVAGAGSSTGGAIYYVYGEITAHHQFYGDKNAMLFYCEEGNKAEVVGGKLPLLRSWAAVPIYLDPLLIIKLSLHVSTNPEHDPDGHTISFQGDLSFDRDQYEKSICNAHHGAVKVRISYE
ncbi:hypothetical protein CFC21_054511 [Triticum aestivum]|uniref:DUF6598 domain-containing protein n=2 Tax=Triticum aestivum TaxID=4565 RepID=A0A9R1K935_WHEAT|nr:hypothetical protein CFC21_054511 [Triticum aestivum]